MTTTTTAPDAALLWAREQMKSHFRRSLSTAERNLIDGGHYDDGAYIQSHVAAFRAGQSHADAGLLAALEPFAKAASRIDHYDGGDFDAPLFAVNCCDAMRELLNGIDGEPITVAHLRAAYAAINAAKGTDHAE